VASATELGMCFQELRQPGSQVPQGPGGRRIPVKVGKDECVEALCSNDSVERWKIFRHHTNQTEPILAVVDLKPFKGGEPGIGADVADSNLLRCLPIFRHPLIFEFPLRGTW